MIANWKIEFVDMYGTTLHTRYATNCTKEYAWELVKSWCPHDHAIDDIKITKDERRKETVKSN